MLTAAVRLGASLTVEQLKQIQKELQHPLPLQGSGKNKNIVRRDRVQALVHFLFPSESEEYREQLIENMCGAESVKPRAFVPEELLSALDGLDAKEQQGFEYLKQMIDEEVAEREATARAASEKPDAHARKNYTPSAFHDLLPQHPGYGLTRSPDIKRYYAWVPCTSAIAIRCYQCLLSLTCREPFICSN